MIGVLRQFVRAASSPRQAPVGKCEICSRELAVTHKHLLELASRKMVCACDACAILFSGQGTAKFRRVPRQIRFLPDFRMTDSQWDGLMMPINMAFFFRSTPENRVVALYPSPAGATESLLSFENWDEIESENPALLEMEPDVEALLVNRIGHSRGFAESQYFIVPGLLGVILQMTMMMMTSVALTREIERGTMENLLAMPVRPIEVMLAKVVPYIVIGYVQVFLIMAMAVAVFGLPVRGSIPLLTLALGLFIASNLALGVTFSTIARNQMQAIQMAQFTLLPSFLLSGFMFPFKGMPVWAQWAGELFPTTHALRIVRGVLLKGNGLAEIAPELWPIGVFTVVVAVIATWCYRVTLD